MSKVLHISRRYLKGAVIDSSNLIEKIYSKGNTKEYADNVWVKQTTTANKPLFSIKNGIVNNDNTDHLLTKNDNLTNTLSFVQTQLDGDYYIGVWAYYDSKSNFYHVFNIITPSSNQIIRMRLDNTASQLMQMNVFYDSINLVTRSAIPTDEWIHYALIKQGSMYYFLQNGILEDTDNVSTDLGSSEHLRCYLGNSSTINTGLDGYWDDFVMYVDETLINPTGYSVGDRVFIPPNRYSGNFTPQKDVVNLDASKGIIYGTSPAVEAWMGNNSELFFKQAMVANQPDFDSVEKAVEFTRADDTYMLSNKPFDYSKPFTISFWVKLKVAETYHRTIDQSNYPTDNNNYLRWENYVEGIRLMEGGSSGTLVMTGGEITDTDWHHIYGVYDGVSITTYVDGYIRVCRLQTLTSFANFNMCIGKIEGYSSQQFDGYLDDFSIKYGYREELTGWTGVSVRYTAGTQVFTPPPRKTS